MKISTRTAVASVAALMMLGAGSVAYAKSAPLAPVPDANGVIHACYTTNDDDPHPYFLRKAACGKKETQIDWNVQGVKGEDGKDGKDGIDGKNGKDGSNGTNGTNGTNGKDGKDGSTSAGYSTSNTTPGAITQTFDVVTLQLPAGKYIVNGTVHVENRDADDDRLVACSLAGDGVETILPDMDGAFPFNQTLALTSSYDAGAGGSVSITCSPQLQNNVTWFTSAHLTAVKVDTLN